MQQKINAVQKCSVKNMPLVNRRRNMGQ